MPERFLILGGNSFYGANFGEHVKTKGDEIDLLSRPRFDLLWERGTWHWLRQIMEQWKPDYIVNFISKSSVVESWDEPSEWIKTNVEATTALLDLLRQYSFKKFIHVSTPEVYGSTPNGEWVTEDCPFNPTTPYAVSRAAGDMMLKAYGKAYGLPYIITRTANIYGPGQRGYRIIPKALTCKQSGEPLPLHGGGQSVRSFIHVRDACEATYLLAKRGAIGETYHISTEVSHYIEDIVAMLECPFEWTPDRLGKDQAYLLNSDKLRKLGWEDTISLEEGLKECELSISQ